MIESLERGKAGPALGVGGLSQDRQPVLAEDLHIDSRYRSPGADRLHENIVAAVNRILDQEAQVSEQNQALVGRTVVDHLFCAGVPVLNVNREQPMGQRARGKHRSEVEDRVLVAACRIRANLPYLFENFREILQAEGALAVVMNEGRVGERTPGLRDEIADGAREQAADLDPNRRHAAGEYRDLTFAGKAEQRPL